MAEVDTILDRISNTGIFQSRGSLALDKPTYITRNTDQLLFDSIKEGHFSYLLTAREMGKTSLRIRTMDRLQKEGYVCSAISMTSLGTINISPEQWYYSYLFQICRGLGLTSKLKSWWRDESDSTPVSRVAEFLSTVVLEDISENIVIFIDEIEAVLSLDISVFNIEEFFASIRSFYNLRVEKPELNRLNFVIMGVAAPHELVKNDENSPFIIGNAFSLDNFQFEEAEPLLMGFEYFQIDRKALLREIFFWTSGQPVLTQRMCEEIAKGEDEIKDIKGTVNAYANQLYLNKDITIESDPHLSAIQNRIVRNSDYNTKMLGVYQEIYNKQFIPLDTNDNVHAALLMSGICRIMSGHLVLNNNIYKEKFDQDWIGVLLKKFDRPFSADLTRWLALNKARSAALKGEVLRQALVWASERDDLSTLEKKFLDFSRRVEKEEERRKRRLLIVLLILALALLLGAIWAAFFAMQQRAKAEVQKNEAVKQRGIAEGQKKIAEDQRKIAETQRKIAEKNLEELKIAEAKLNEALKEANRQKDIARAAQIQAELNAIKFKQQKLIADREAAKAKRLSLLSKAQSLAFKATLKNDDPQINGLLAMQGYRFNNENGGSSYDPTIYEGLRSALNKIDPNNKNKFMLDADLLSSFVFGEQNSLIALSLSSQLVLYDINQGKIIGKRYLENPDYSPIDKSFIFASQGLAVIEYADGKVFLDRIGTEKNIASPMVGHNGLVRAVAISPNGKYLATGARDALIKVWDLDNLSEGSKYDVKLKGSVRSLVFTNDNEHIISADESGAIVRSNFITGMQDTIDHQPEKRAISLAIDPKQETLAVGYSNGLIEIFDMYSFELITPINNAGEISIDQITIDNTSQMMAVANALGVIKIYRLNDIGEQPITLSDHNSKIQELMFNPDGRLFALCRDNYIRQWETDNDALAAKICNKLNRNMTKEEWNREVGAGIPYVETCPQKTLQ